MKVSVSVMLRMAPKVDKSARFGLSPPRKGCAPTASAHCRADSYSSSRGSPNIPYFFFSRPDTSLRSPQPWARECDYDTDASCYLSEDTGRMHPRRSTSKRSLLLWCRRTPCTSEKQCSCAVTKSNVSAHMAGIAVTSGAAAIRRLLGSAASQAMLMGSSLAAHWNRLMGSPLEPPDRVRQSARFTPAIAAKSRAPISSTRTRDHSRTGGWQTSCSGNRRYSWGSGGRRPPHGGCAKHTAKLTLRPGKVALLGDVVEGLERLGTVAVDVDGQHPHQARIHPPSPPLLLLCSISGVTHECG